MTIIADLVISLVFAVTVFQAAMSLGMLWVIGAEAYDDTE